MDITASEAELMRASRPTDVFADIRIWPTVICIDDCGAAANVEPISSPTGIHSSACSHIASSDCNARLRVGIERSIHAQFGPGGKAVRNLWDLLTGDRKSTRLNSS